MSRRSKALGNDIAKNLQAPLAEIYQLAGREGILLPSIRVAVRSGDTPAQERQAMVRKPPHILITTPESLYILLTSARSREFLRSAETLILDEIHAIAQDKRGAHLSLSIERLAALAERPLQRIGLSATQKPIDEVARLLVGTKQIRPDGTPACTIVDVGHKREMELRIEVPDEELGPIIRQDIWSAVYDKLVEQIRAHRTTLIFVNTRRLVERVSHQLSERLGEGKVGAHHGSLSRKTRLEVEEKLKSGLYPVVVATASLELGIDIGHVDLVCHIGAPRNLAVLLQRVGRSGHWMGAIPKGLFYPLTRDDLMQSIAAIRAVRQGQLDKLNLTYKPLDILAQQMVATVASSENLTTKSTKGTKNLPPPSSSAAMRGRTQEGDDEGIREEDAVAAHAQRLSLPRSLQRRVRASPGNALRRGRDAAQPAQRLYSSRSHPWHVAAAARRALDGDHQRRGDSRHRRLQRCRVRHRDLRRHGQRGFRHRKLGRRYFSLGQSLLAHSARRFRQSLGRRRSRTAAEYSLLDGRGAGAHGGVVAGGIRSARCGGGATGRPRRSGGLAAQAK